MGYKFVLNDEAADDLERLARPYRSIDMCPSCWRRNEVDDDN